ncbi:DUF317 domain-containing protein [Streptomyces rubiginosohelvolus]|uniref:DUF317 domain-containing protein n=1 Tax=Streptomyces rubiginosohelvolus TaxID=67362 RepID=UPI0035DF5F63
MRAEPGCDGAPGTFLGLRARNEGLRTPRSSHDESSGSRRFVNSHGHWERNRAWDDNCSYANHESLTLRAELNHEAAWQIAAYTSPGGALVWEVSATTIAPVALVRGLLENAADHLGPAPPDPGTLDKHVTRATSSLIEADWRQRTDSRWITWTAWGHATTDQSAWAGQRAARCPPGPHLDPALASTTRAAGSRSATSMVAPTPPLATEGDSPTGPFESLASRHGGPDSAGPLAGTATRRLRGPPR